MEYQQLDGVERMIHERVRVKGLIQTHVELRFRLDVHGRCTTMDANTPEVKMYENLDFQYERR